MKSIYLKVLLLSFSVVVGGQESKDPFEPNDSGERGEISNDPFVPNDSDDRDEISKDPFEPNDSGDRDGCECDAHRWVDQIVEANNAVYIKFTGNDGIHHNKDSITFSFSVDKKDYLESLKHEDSNRGVILISGDLESPATYCWMRPFMFAEDTAEFVVTVPKIGLEKTYFAFIPKNGKLRYLYKASSVLKHFGRAAEKK